MWQVSNFFHEHGIYLATVSYGPAQGTPVRACNNFLACETVDYQLTVAATNTGWVFRDEEGESPAFRMPETPGKGVVAFTSEASFNSTMMLVLYSGGPALLIDAFEEPGFFSLNGSCDLIQ